MSTEYQIRIAEDFSRTLGARYRYEGKFSGQEFLEDFLEPKFKKAREHNRKLDIYLDGVFGYPSSFVSGSFGKLSLQFGEEQVLRFVNLVSDNPVRIERIELEIKNPKSK